MLESVSLLDFSSVVNIWLLFSSHKGFLKLTDLGGFKDLGKAYLTTQSANDLDYNLKLSDCPNLTHDSLMNVINNLYDIASIGVQTQQLTLGTTNKAKLTAEEIAIATNKGWSVS